MTDTATMLASYVERLREIVDERDRLRKRNGELLFALRALTRLDPNAPDGVVVGPHGWRIVQDAIEEEEV